MSIGQLNIFFLFNLNINYVGHSVCLVILVVVTALDGKYYISTAPLSAPRPVSGSETAGRAAGYLTQ